MPDEYMGWTFCYECGARFTPEEFEVTVNGCKVCSSFAIKDYTPWAYIAWQEETS